MSEEIFPILIVYFCIKKDESSIDINYTVRKRKRHDLILSMFELMV